MASAVAGGGAEAIRDIVDGQESTLRAIIYGWSHHGRQAGVGSDEQKNLRSSGKLVTLKTVEKHMARVLSKPLDHESLVDRPALSAIFFHP